MPVFGMSTCLTWCVCALCSAGEGRVNEMEDQPLGGGLSKGSWDFCVRHAQCGYGVIGVSHDRREGRISSGVCDDCTALLIAQQPPSRVRWAAHGIRDWGVGGYSSCQSDVMNFWSLHHHVSQDGFVKWVIDESWSCNCHPVADILSSQKNFFFNTRIAITSSQIFSYDRRHLLKEKTIGMKNEGGGRVEGLQNDVFIDFLLKANIHYIFLEDALAHIWERVANFSLDNIPADFLAAQRRHHWKSHFWLPRSPTITDIHKHEMTNNRFHIHNYLELSTKTNTTLLTITFTISKDLWESQRQQYWQKQRRYY